MRSFLKCDEYRLKSAIGNRMCIVCYLGEDNEDTQHLSMRCPFLNGIREISMMNIPNGFSGEVLKHARNVYKAWLLWNMCSLK